MGLVAAVAVLVCLFDAERFELPAVPLCFAAVTVPLRLTVVAEPAALALGAGLLRLVVVT